MAAPICSEASPARSFPKRKGLSKACGWQGYREAETLVLWENGALGEKELDLVSAGKNSEVLEGHMPCEKKHVKTW